MNNLNKTLISFGLMALTACGAANSQENKAATQPATQSATGETAEAILKNFPA